MQTETELPKKTARLLSRALWPLRRLRLRAHPQKELARATALHRVGSLFAPSFKTWTK
jgi:hypothetical protein